MGPWGLNDKKKIQFFLLPYFHVICPDFVLGSRSAFNSWPMGIRVRVRLSVRLRVKVRLRVSVRFRLRL